MNKTASRNRNFGIITQGVTDNIDQRVSRSFLYRNFIKKKQIEAERGTFHLSPIFRRASSP